jgi:hypothetical protein
MFGGGWNRVMDTALGGWKVSGAAILYSGFPITITSNNNANMNSETARADQNMPLQIVNRSLKNWFGRNGTTAYSPELTGQFGTARVGTERSPGFDQVDLSVFKVLTIKERQNLQFRTDFFNAFNIASYGAPVSSVSSATFGQITSTLSPPRQIQLSASYHF